jgi:hypothetical protein
MHPPHGMIHAITRARAAGPAMRPQRQALCTPAPQCPGKYWACDSGGDARLRTVPLRSCTPRPDDWQWHAPVRGHGDAAALASGTGGSASSVFTVHRIGTPILFGRVHVRVMRRVFD